MLSRTEERWLKHRRRAPSGASLHTRMARHVRDGHTKPLIRTPASRTSFSISCRVLPGLALCLFVPSTFELSTVQYSVSVMVDGVEFMDSVCRLLGWLPGGVRYISVRRTGWDWSTVKRLPAAAEQLHSPVLE